MTTEASIQAFIVEQRCLLQLERERFKKDQQAVGIDLDVEEGRKGASLPSNGVGLPQTIVADNGCQFTADGQDLIVPNGNDNRNDVLLSQNQNDPLVEPLPLSCDGRCLDKEKQAFLVQSDNPLTFTRSNVRHTPSPSLQSPATSPPSRGNSPPGLGTHDRGTARMLRRGAGEYSPSNRRVNTQTHIGFGLANLVKQQQKHTAQKSSHLGFGLSNVVQQKQKQDTQQTEKKNNYVGLGGLSDIVSAQQKQQKQRQDLNLNLNNVNKPKHNRHVHYNSTVIGGTEVDATIYEYGPTDETSNVYKSNLNKIQQEDNSYLHDTAINNNQPARRGIIAHNQHRNINLNINNNIADDPHQSSTLFVHHEESSDLDLTDVDCAPRRIDSDDSGDNYNCTGRGDCACAPTDCVMHHNSRSPILHRLDRTSGIGTSSGTSGLGTTSRLSHMDKPRSILSNRYYTSSNSPRERLLSDLKHTYVPTSVYDGFSFSDRTEEYERERVKKELYQNELRLQIEEKRRQATMRENQERVEQELENRRLEQQLLRMHEEELRDEERRTLRRNSEDLHRRAQEIGSRATYQRRHTDSESSLHKMPSPYSPPMTRRNQMHNMAGAAASASVYDTSPVTSRYNAHAVRNRMDSLSDSYGMYNTYGGGRSTIDGASVFNRYDSLSRIDALKQQHTALNRLENLTLNDSYSNRIQRRHSATHQDLSSSRRSPKLQRRSSSSRFDSDSLPIPLLKAASHSPVARDLRMATAVNSNKYSDSLRRLEEKWQIPAVQKNIMSYDMYPDGHNRSILTQLGSMRMQLQQEQLRMDEALRRRGYSSQYKAVNFH